MFVDEVKVVARAGHGGPGCIAFRREAYIPKGGPDGGNGGKGGDVVLEATHDLNNLLEQFFNPRLIAQNGQNGMGKGMDGKAGKDIVIKVPCGTLVWCMEDTTPDPDPESSKSAGDRPMDPAQAEAEAEDAAAAAEAGEDDDDETARLPVGGRGRAVIRTSGNIRALEVGLEEDDAKSDVPLAKGELVADLTTDGQRFILCKGGRGGLGNRNFATSRHQSPRYAQPGEHGTEGRYLLELRMMADVGLVGYPNAGKSTLLTAISHARPKIAAYPFTTLSPNLGVVPLSDHRSFVVADIPGIIEGASTGKGLGLQFLRHIERTRILAFIIPIDAMDWQLEYDQLRAEITAHSAELAATPHMVVFSKLDLMGEDYVPEIEAPGAFARMSLSGANRTNLDEFLDICWRKLLSMRQHNEAQIRASEQVLP